MTILWAFNKSASPNQKAVEIESQHPAKASNKGIEPETDDAYSSLNIFLLVWSQQSCRAAHPPSGHTLPMFTASHSGLNDFLSMRAQGML